MAPLVSLSWPRPRPWSSAKMELIVICVALVVLAIAIAHIRSDECPREILGYRCKGETCDHSKIEVARAKVAMGKGNRWL